MNVLVIDVGGTHVKLLASGAMEPRKFNSGDGLTPEQLVAGIRETAEGWQVPMRSRSAFPLPCSAAR